MEPLYYTVLRLDGDYAMLLCDGDAPGEANPVARALLPEEIEEGSRLVLSNMEYSNSLLYITIANNIYLQYFLYIIGRDTLCRCVSCAHGCARWPSRNIRNSPRR